MILNIRYILLASLLFGTVAVAQEHHNHSGEFYVVTKALMTSSETISEGDDVMLKGETGGGLGVDIGYTLPYHFALEVDTSYSQNSVEESRMVDVHGHSELEHMQADALYWTYAFDATYTLPLPYSFGLMGKIGYEFEHEEIKYLHVNADESGMVFGAGLEYHLSSHYEALVEYEKSTIESPRGASLYAGVKYIF